MILNNAIKNEGFNYPIENIPHKGKIYIYGTGSSATAFYAWLIKCRPNIKVLGFLDRYHSGHHIDIPVYTLELFLSNISESSYNEILIVSIAFEDIKKNLQSRGIKKYRVITPSIYLLANIFIDPTTAKKKFLKLTNKVSQDTGDLHLFFGENFGKFVGNNKYYYLYLKKFFPEKVYWVAENTACIKFFKKNNIPVIDFNKDNFIDYLNNASHFYFDKMSWQKKYPWLSYFKAKKIHTSHGVGLKYTEIMEIPDNFLEKLNTLEKQWLYNNIFKNDLLLSTSEFYAKNVSEPAYGTSMDKISLAGYPKNDVLYQHIKGEKIFSDLDGLNFISKRKKEGYKIICYAPTWRKLDSSHKDSNALDLTKINNFCINIKAIFILKGHGLTETATQEIANLCNIINYNNENDIYPALRDTDVLITDYSSIYMDFLHVRKPIIFFPYDMDSYTTKNNPLQFDYQSMTPGPKVYNWNELKHCLEHFLVDKQDGYEEQRDVIFSLAYKKKSLGACERLFNDIKKLGKV